MDACAEDWLFAAAAAPVSSSIDLSPPPANTPSSPLWSPALSPFFDSALPFDPFPHLQPDGQGDLSDIKEVPHPLAHPTTQAAYTDRDEQRAVSECSSGRDHRRTPSCSTLAPQLKGGRGVGGVRRRSSHDAGSRQRRNALMRDNRGRFKVKFAELTTLLERLSAAAGRESTSAMKPMKNNLQVLERAMVQYAQLETERARCKSELLFAGGARQGGWQAPQRRREMLEAAGGEGEMCEMVVRTLCARQGWKYGEVWAGESEGKDGLGLQAAFVSAGNTAATRARLEGHARRVRKAGGGGGLRQAMRLRHATWVADVGKGEGGEERTAAGLSTSLAVGVRTRGADRVVVVMHADDEMLAFPGGVRPYDAESVRVVTEMARAVEERWREV